MHPAHRPRLLPCLLAPWVPTLAAACGGGTPADPDVDAGPDPGTDAAADACPDADVRGDAAADTDGSCIDIDRDGHCRPAECDDENDAVNPAPRRSAATPSTTTAAMRLTKDASRGPAPSTWTAIPSVAPARTTIPAP